MNHKDDEIATRHALLEFRKLIPPGGRVLVAGCGEGQHIDAFTREGFLAEGFDVSPAKISRATARVPGARVWTADVRLLSVPKESYDAVWAHELFRALDPPACQRSLGIFFAALKRDGALFTSIETPPEVSPNGESPASPASGDGRHRYARADFASLLRQSGFRVLAEGSPVGATNPVGFLARRV